MDIAPTASKARWNRIIICTGPYGHTREWMSKDIKVV
jgi:hypothetical protein